MAKYNKGEFITIPNKSALRGLSPNLQVVFFWLCDHSDDNMQSFPSRKTLAIECGMSVDSLDRAMRQLVSLGLIQKTPRKVPLTAGVQNYTNLYEVLIVAAESGNNSIYGGGVAADSGQVAAKTTLGSRKNRTENSIHLTQPNNSISTNVLVDSAKPSPRPQSFELLFKQIVEALGFTEGVRFTTGRRDKLKRRNKTYNWQELVVAARNLGSDEFMQGDNPAGKRYGDIDYFLRNDENIDKYLNKPELKLSEGAF